MENYYPWHCFAPTCKGDHPKVDCTCQCGDCGAAAADRHAFLFEVIDHGTDYAPGTLVEAVGIGKSRSEDDPGEPVHESFIFGRGVFDVEEPTDEDDLCPWWYFREKSLKPLTSAARRMHADLRRRNRHLPENSR